MLISKQISGLFLLFSSKRICCYSDARQNTEMDLCGMVYRCSNRLRANDTRKYAKEILNSIGAKQTVTDRDRARIAISYHCLSLMDVFWVKQNREPVTFSDLSLFRNSMSGAFADVSLDGRQLTVQNSEILSGVSKWTVYCMSGPFSMVRWFPRVTSSHRSSGGSFPWNTWMYIAQTTA